MVASNGASPSATAGPFTVAVGGSSGKTADLAIVVTGPATAARGSTATYTAVVSNNGPATALKGLVLLAIGPGATAVSATPAGGAGAGGIWAWTVPSLAVGQSVTMTFTVRLSTAGTVFTLGTVGSTTPDSKLVNNVVLLKTVVK